jgi:hypothetical protein
MRVLPASKTTCWTSCGVSGVDTRDFAITDGRESAPVALFLGIRRILSGRQIGRSIGKASGIGTICRTNAAGGSADDLHSRREESLPSSRRQSNECSRRRGYQALAREGRKVRFRSGSPVRRRNISSLARSASASDSNTNAVSRSMSPTLPSTPNTVKSANGSQNNVILLRQYQPLAARSSGRRSACWFRFSTTSTLARQVVVLRDSPSPATPSIAPHLHPQVPG